MRSKFLQEIINETPQEVDKRVSKWADQMKRAARYEARRRVYFNMLNRKEILLANERRPLAGFYEVGARNYEQQEID